MYVQFIQGSQQIYAQEKSLGRLHIVSLCIKQGLKLIHARASAAVALSNQDRRGSILTTYAMSCVMK